MIRALKVIWRRVADWIQYVDYRLRQRARIRRARKEDPNTYPFW